MNNELLIVGLISMQVVYHGANSQITKRNAHASRNTKWQIPLMIVQVNRYCWFQGD